MNNKDTGTEKLFSGSVFRVLLIALIGGCVLFLCVSLNRDLDSGLKQADPPAADKSTRPEAEITIETAAETRDETKSADEESSAANQQSTESQTKVPDKQELSPQQANDKQRPDQQTTLKQLPGKQEQPEQKAPAAKESGADTKNEEAAKKPQQEEAPEEKQNTDDASKEAMKIAEAIAATVAIDRKSGSISYAQEEIPKNLHLSFKAEAFNKNGACIGRYVSDAGWMLHPENYDASAKQVRENLGVSDFDGAMVIINILIRQTDDGSTPGGRQVSLQIKSDYDGTLSQRSTVK